MRTLFLILIFGLLAGVGVVALIKTEPGYVLISYGNYTLETSVWVGLVLLVLFTTGLYLAISLIWRLLRSRSWVSGWLGGRRNRRGAKQTNKGLINFIEGNWQRARTQLLSGARKTDAPLINYLIAARASYQLDEPEKMREYLAQADASETGAGIAVEITQAEIQLGAGQYEQAAATLVRARRNAGRHPYVLSLLLKAYLGLRDWQELALLIPDCRRYQVKSEAELDRLEREVARNQLMQAAHAAGEGDAEAVLHRQWQALPANLRKDTTLGALYVRMLLESKAQGAAEKVCLRLLKSGWNDELVHLYGLIESDDASRQLGRAEKWLVDHPGDSTLLLALGRLAARDRLWGRARDYFEQCFRQQPSAEVCAELGRLLEQLGEPALAASYYRKGLQLEFDALPALPMPDDSGPKRLAAEG